MDLSTIQAIQEKLKYPANQEYDPETLDPRGVAKKRLALMERNMPELLNGGDSLLDVGFNKGLVPFLLRKQYRRIVGYEPSTPYYELARAVQDLHGIENIYFYNAPFRFIKVDRMFRYPYDVVYAGSVHHHLVKNAILHGAPLFLSLRKLGALAKTYLIIDGPLSFGDDCSLNTWEKQHGWGPGVRAAYTPEGHIQELSPQFELVRGPLDNERGRQTLVFKRIAPDVPHTDVTHDEIRQLQQAGEDLRGNRARGERSVVRLGDRRLKLDKGTQSDGVLSVLNGLNYFVPHTHEVLMRNGLKAGDIAEFIDGIPLETGVEIWPHWLRLNDVLASVGLVDLHFKLRDYLERDGRVFNVDLDLIWNTDRMASNVTFVDRWTDRMQLLLPEKYNAAIQFIHDHLRDEFVFQQAAKMVKD